MNDFFVHNGAESLIHNNKPKIWIHGHTHEYFDYIHVNTRVITNPKGYIHETRFHTSEYNPKIIEI